MATELTESFSKALENRGIDDSTWNAITSSIFPGANQNSILLAIDYCKSRDLDIMKKPCHIVPMKVTDARSNREEWRDIIMPGIAEHRITAARTRVYAGIDAPLLGEFMEFTIGGEKIMAPEWAEVTVYRMVEGQRVAFSHKEWFEEACSTKKDGKLNAMWKKRKRGQLIKCAEAGALRKAFPEELGGMYVAEEMDGKVIDVSGTEVVEDTETEGTLGAAGVKERIKEAKAATKPAQANGGAPKQQSASKEEIVDGEYTEVPKQTETKQEPKPEPATAVADPIGPNKVAVIKGMLAKNDKTPEWLFKQLNINGYGQINNADMNKVLSTISGSK